MKKIVILSTDTPHHRYFINKIIKQDYCIEKVIFETDSIIAPFPTEPVLEDDANKFERKNFFCRVSSDIEEVEVEQVENINDYGLEYRNIDSDLGIVFGTRKISNRVISLFKDGLINIHRGNSCYYRGIDSDLWAIYHDDYDNIGVTVHKVSSELDKGDIYKQANMKLLFGMKTYQIRYYTTLIATDIVLSALNDYINKKMIYYPHPKFGRYYSFMPLDLKKVVSNKFNIYCEKLGLS